MKMRMNHMYGGRIRRRYILNWLNVKFQTRRTADRGKEDRKEHDQKHRYWTYKVKIWCCVSIIKSSVIAYKPVFLKNKLKFKINNFGYKFIITIVIIEHELHFKSLFTLSFIFLITNSCERLVKTEPLLRKLKTHLFTKISIQFQIPKYFKFQENDFSVLGYGNKDKTNYKFYLRCMSM